MLLYNQRKEFIGVDHENLSELGFLNIAELQNESHDFADLFVKKPGFIHNFKNFSWIDFILHSEASEDPKAVIHAKGKNYACKLHVTPFSFASGESGFSIALKNLRLLKGAEDEQATRDLEAAGGVQSSAAIEPAKIPEPRAEKESPEVDVSFDDVKLSTPEDETQKPAVPEPELPNFEESYTQELSEPEPFDIPESDETDSAYAARGENEFGAPVGIDYNAPLTLDDDVMSDSFEEPAIEEEEVLSLQEPAQSEPKETPMLGDYVTTDIDSQYLSDLIKSGDYVYDPKIAANELGLPVDLIEEFIGDFIDQAHEFHDDLFASVRSGDFDNVQNLSHKLKGVAANLRVEDAFDTLSVVNNSKDVDEILPNLNYFYKIIAKLEGKEVPQETSANTNVAAPEPAIEDEEIDYNIGIKHPEKGPLLIHEDEIAPASDDEIYGDLLGSKEASSFTQETESEAPPATQNDDDDIYGDLLSTDGNEMNETKVPSHEESMEEGLSASSNTYEETSIPESEPENLPATQNDDDDIYGDLLSTDGNEMNETEVPSHEELLPSPDTYAEPSLHEQMTEAEDEDYTIPLDTSFEDNFDTDGLDDSDSYAEPVQEEEEDLTNEDYTIPADSSLDESFDEDILGSSDRFISPKEETEEVRLDFDAQRTANELGIPLDIVNEFVQDFKEQIRSHQNDFNEAITTADIKKVNQTATLLKGMSDNLRLNEISEVLRQLQQEDDINNTTQALATLQAYVDQI